jgi:hypothetical protein
MNIKAINEEIAGVVGEIPGLTDKSHWYPIKKPSVPAWIMAVPSEIDPHSTYGRGMFETTQSGYLVISIADMEALSEVYSRHVSMDSPDSIVLKIEGHSYQSCDSVRVRLIREEPISLGGVIYLGVRFVLDIHGRVKGIG